MGSKDESHSMEILCGVWSRCTALVFGVILGAVIGFVEEQLLVGSPSLSVCMCVCVCEFVCWCV